MNWWLQQFFLYCERGSDPAFWAEPFNALSNGAFLIAAGIAWLELKRSSKRLSVEHALIGLAGTIGIASFLFHTTAARWAFVFDTGSIAVMSFAYLVYALRRFARANWASTVAALVVMGLCFPLVRLLPCPAAGLMPITAAAGHPCLNGSLGYLPVIAAMGLTGALLSARRHQAGRYILAAAAVFAASLAVRSVDTEICAASIVWGRARGTHALWHILNALAIYLLLAAAVRYGWREDSRR